MKLHTKRQADRADGRSMGSVRVQVHEELRSSGGLMVHFIGVLCVLLLALIAGCGRSGGSSHTGVPSEDAWTRFLPTGDPGGFDEVSSDEFCLVPEAMQAEAQLLLAIDRAVVLSGVDSRRFGGDRLGVPRANAKAVLLRALVADEDESGNTKADRLEVLWRAGVVDVRHVSSRTRHVPKTRRAVLALLPAEPKDVYTSAVYAIYGGVDSE
ncbi:MAG: hypothetical protein QF903_00545 [Planctomycetota bacterium]|nr:hypothetical protein [Planctomycetota bacterium]MDP6987948.1 hypothetical protein [Planctomycetota bacterium]